MAIRKFASNRATIESHPLSGYHSRSFLLPKQCSQGANMARRLAVRFTALLALFSACHLPLYAQKAAPIAPAEPLKDVWEAIDERLLFLMTRLASVEASLDAVEKALKTTSGKTLVKVADAKRAELDNRAMDRKGGGPMKWSDFYGTTAEKFFYHPVDRNTTYHTVTILGTGSGASNPQPPHNRPPQFDYIYRANESAKTSAEKDVAALAKKSADLLARRRSLEEEQSALWCEIAFRAVSRLDLPRKPLYRFELTSASSESGDMEKREALAAATMFCRTAFSIVAAAENSQANAFGSIKKTIRDAREQLDDAWIRRVSLQNQFTDNKSSPGRFAALTKRLEDVSSNLADSYLVSIDGDRFKDEQRKETFRGLLQQSLLSYAQIALALDEMAGAMAKEWKITSQVGKLVAVNPKAKAKGAPARSTTESVPVAIIESITGTWRVSKGTYRADWTFYDDGLITSTNGAPKGKWTFLNAKSQIYVDWGGDGKAWEAFNLPFDGHRLRGEAWDKYPVEATKARLEPRRDGDNRAVWVHPNGKFRQLSSDTWEETIAGERNAFTENARKKEFVELKRDNGNTVVRLYDDRCDVKLGAVAPFNTFYKGEWRPY